MPNAQVSIDSFGDESAYQEFLAKKAEVSGHNL